uniref:Transcriptional regulator, MarR family n=2 Tax=Gloeothece TaxID=28070 RepID=E0UG57_GLOV7|nr:transcriptional regulator, MarR family [Gloeothece verrucosa PCC 7822]
MEVMPLVMNFIRTQMRSHSASLLTVPQFRVLAFLKRHPDCSLSAVAEHLGVSRPTASAMVERLVQQGFVNRSEHPQERRQVELKLTEAGYRYFEQIREKTRKEIADQLGNLSETQLSSLREGIALLYQVFNQWH